MSTNLRFSTSKAQTLFARQFASTRNVAISLALKDNDVISGEASATFAGRVVIEGKGLAGEAARSNSAQVRKQMALFDAIREVQSQLSALAYKSGSSPEESQHLQERLDALQSKQARLGQRTEADAKASLNSIRRALAVDTALIDWILYRPYDPTQDRTVQTQSKQHLVAVIVRHHEPPRIVDLGPVEPIKAQIALFRKQITGRNGAINTLGQTLYDALLGPLLPTLEEATTLIISPDGPLHSLPFAAIMNQEGAYLAETYTLRYVTNSRDLIHLSTPAFPARSPPMVLADAQFDSETNLKAVAQNTIRGHWSNSLAKSMAPLPGTRIEAQQVAKRLKLSRRLFLGEAATETRLRTAKGPRILHIATHGFFLPDSHGKTPMLRAGLALAGYNHRQKSSHDNDGLLTALDISGLDLYGTELVVLSACETGLGQVSGGEGLYGLKRALFLSGSRSQVLSLWKVDDIATQAMMNSFYEQLLKGVSRANALRHVQTQMIGGHLNTMLSASDKKRGISVAGAKHNSTSTVAGWRHPYYWASFTLSGADGPVELPGSAP